MWEKKLFPSFSFCHPLFFLSFTHTRTNTHTRTHTLSDTHTHYHTHTHPSSNRHTQTHSHTPLLSLTHTPTYTDSYTPTNTLIHSHTLSCSHSFLDTAIGPWFTFRLVNVIFQTFLITYRVNCQSIPIRKTATTTTTTTFSDRFLEEDELKLSQPRNHGWDPSEPEFGRMCEVNRQDAALITSHTKATLVRWTAFI